MAKAAPAPQRRPRPWLGPLVVGVCFGLGYGVSQRLFNLQVGELVQFGRNFDVQPFPGSSLESLRLRFGSDSESILADPSTSSACRPRRPPGQRPRPRRLP